MIVLRRLVVAWTRFYSHAIRSRAVSEPGPAASHTLQVRNISKRYGRLTALSDVTFAIRPGEILGLIGPNGSGKTTLLECLAGLLPFESGAVFQNNRPVGPRERLSILFYLPDAVAPWPSQSVRRAIEFTLGFFGGRVDARDEVVRRLNLEPLLDSAIGSLSKGQRKRVLLAIGLLAPQPVLLADEPFDGLDVRQTRDVAAALRTFVVGGRTLCLSIHQISAASRICDRFVLLSGGRVCGEGTLEELSTLAARGDGTTVHDLEDVFLALT
jgi:ABC-2 type transport system ATP-binding protein